MPTREDVFTAADDEAMARLSVGESSQPYTHHSQQPEHQKILFPDHSAALPADAFNGLPVPAGQVCPSSPLTKLAQDMDDMSYESLSGTSSVSQPIPFQSTALKSQHPKTSIDTGEGGPSGASSVSSMADNHTRAELSAATKLPPPQSASPLNIATSTRNGAPSSPMPLYAQNLMDDHQLWCHSSDNSVSEPEFVGHATHTYPPEFTQISYAMKRKRKHQSKDSEKEHSAADPDVVAATQDVIALLQMYGPLSYVQLRVNIETQFEGEDSVPVKKLQQVLDILVELGVIHIVEGTNDPGRTSSTAEAGSESDITKNNPVYSFGSGAIRMDVALPSNVLGEITEAGSEIFETRQRIDFLHSVLCIDQPSASTDADSEKKPSKREPKPLTQEFAKKALSEMLENHPDIINDPTYAAALRLFKVQDTTQQNEKKPSASESGTGSSKKRKRPKPDNTSAIDAIAENKTGIDSPQINRNKSAS